MSEGSERRPPEEVAAVCYDVLEGSAEDFITIVKAVADRFVECSALDPLWFVRLIGVYMSNKGQAALLGHIERTTITQGEVSSMGQRIAALVGLIVHREAAEMIKSARERLEGMSYLLGPAKRNDFRVAHRIRGVETLTARAYYTRERGARITDAVFTLCGWHVPVHWIGDRFPVVATLADGERAGLGQLRGCELCAQADRKIERERSAREAIARSQNKEG